MGTWGVVGCAVRTAKLSVGKESYLLCAPCFIKIEETAMKKKGILVLLIILLLALSGCSGRNAFHQYARAGDTVALAAGWKHSFSKDSITVTITPAGGTPVVYAPNDDRIRAVVNLYPDPLSSLVVSDQVGTDLTPFSRTYSDLLNFVVTDNDNDWWETSVFIDLPVSLTVGPAKIKIASAAGETYSSSVEIIAGAGSANAFDTYEASVLNSYMIATLERVAHHTIRFSGDTVPYAMQLEFNHQPSSLVHVANPRGDLKNLAWTDDGTNLRVVMTPANLGGIDSLKDCKFYVAGQVNGLSLLSLKAVDRNGNAITTVTAVID